ncbi:hypothetical protein HK101_001220 [Irineochytrium annulatum]|nr:hypothetical protein HK101_001220 [Irineochytrium annulatum]
MASRALARISLKWAIIISGHVNPVAAVSHILPGADRSPNVKTSSAWSRILVFAVTAIGMLVGHSRELVVFVATPTILVSNFTGLTPNVTLSVNSIPAAHVCFFPGQVVDDFITLSTISNATDKKNPQYLMTAVPARCTLAVVTFVLGCPSLEEGSTLYACQIGSEQATSLNATQVSRQPCMWTSTGALFDLNAGDSVALNVAFTLASLSSRSFDGFQDFIRPSTSTSSWNTTAWSKSDINRVAQDAATRTTITDRLPVKVAVGLDRMLAIEETVTPIVHAPVGITPNDPVSYFCFFFHLYDDQLALLLGNMTSAYTYTIVANNATSSSSQPDKRMSFNTTCSDIQRAYDIMLSSTNMVVTQRYYLENGTSSATIVMRNTAEISMTITSRSFTSRSDPITAALASGRAALRPALQFRHVDQAKDDNFGLVDYALTTNNMMQSCARLEPCRALASAYAEASAGRYLTSSSVSVLSVPLTIALAFAGLTAATILACLAVALAVAIPRLVGRVRHPDPFQVLYNAATLGADTPGAGSVNPILLVKGWDYVVRQEGGGSGQGEERFVVGRKFTRGLDAGRLQASPYGGGAQLDGKRAELGPSY